MKQPKILCYGSLNIDYVYQVNKIFKPGETIESRSMQIFAGGKGANQSIAVARAGGHVHHAGRIGKDDEWILSGLKSEGVNVDKIVRSDAVTGHAVIQVDADGENAICIHGGANHSIEKSDIDETIGGFEAGSILMLQNETNELAYMLRTGADRNMFICLNASPISDSLLALDMSDVRLLVVNESEAAALTFNSGDEFRKLKDRCPRAIIVKTMGSQGGEALAPDSDNVIVYHSREVKAVDTTAAGDTFLGYLVTGLSQDEPLESALNTAAKAAEHCIKVRGAQTSIPLRNKIIF